MPDDVVATIRLLKRAITRAASTAFSASGVGTKQVAVLRELREAGPVSQVELARSTLTDPAAMMRTIDALQRRRWVERTSCEGDRRCKLVSLTPGGEQALRGLDVVFDSLRAAGNAPLTAAERRQFCALAARVTAALEAVASAPPAPEAPRAPRPARRRTEKR